MNDFKEKGYHSKSEMKRMETLRGEPQELLPSKRASLELERDLEANKHRTSVKGRPSQSSKSFKAGWDKCLTRAEEEIKRLREKLWQLHEHSQALEENAITLALKNAELRKKK